MIEQQRHKKLAAMEGEGRSGRVDGRETALSSREQEVLRLAQEGPTYVEIAGKLMISPHTVNTHIKRVCQKLGVSGARQAAAQARRLGLLTLEEVGT